MHIGLMRGVRTFPALTDTPVGYVGQALKYVRVNAGEDALEFAAAVAASFLALTDTPADYVGQALKQVRVNAGEDALEFVSASVDGALEWFIDGGGSVITTGIKGTLEVPFDCSIKVGTLLGDQSGSIVIDIWKDTYANYPPTDADSITAAAPLTISSAQKSKDSTLTGWTISLSKGDILYYNVDSVDTFLWVLVSLLVEKS